MDKAATEQKIKEMAGKIVKEFQPEKIILFGSWAWGKPTEDSDVDLLVVKDSEKSRREQETELRERLLPVGMAFDILVFTPQELEEKIAKDRNLFLEDIVKNGVVLYATDKIR